MNNTIKIAYHLSSNKFIHIDNAKNGLACNCECIRCKERLEAVQGKIRAKHFRHHVNINCKGSQETALHELGKQILVNSQQINIPGNGIVTYSDAIAEKKYESIRPDVTATYNKQKIFFEIYVSHAIDTAKEKFYINGKYKSIEIDLQGYETSKYREIKKLVLNETKNKRLIFWDNESSLSTKSKDQKVKNNDDNSFHEIFERVIIGAIVFFGMREIIRFLNRRKRR